MEQHVGNGDAPAPYTLSLEGKGITVNRQISEAMALQIVNVVLGGPASLGRGVSTSSRSATSASSLREFLDTTKAKGNVEKIVAIGKYVSDQLSQETFTREDVKNRFRTAGERTPANLARDFGLAISAGWIAEDPASRGDYYVTQTGADALVEGFTTKARRGPSQGRRPKRRSRKPGVSVKEETAGRSGG
jgi:hypothetical protein